MLKIPQIINYASVLVFASLQNAFAEHKSVELKHEQHEAPASWVNQESIQCLDTKVTVFTHCSEKLEDLPYCETQKISFVSTTVNKEVTYRYHFDGGNQPFITGASCYKKDNKTYIVLDRTNFGNCGDCEWNDMYAETGEYLGSGKGMYQKELIQYGRKKISHKKMTQAAESILGEIYQSTLPSLAQSNSIFRTR
jgi:hypothetical protein